MKVVLVEKIRYTRPFLCFAIRGYPKQDPGVFVFPGALVFPACPGSFGPSFVPLARVLGSVLYQQEVRRPQVLGGVLYSTVSTRPGLGHASYAFPPTTDLPRTWEAFFSRHVPKHPAKKAVAWEIN